MLGVELGCKVYAEEGLRKGGWEWVRRVRV